MGRSQVSAPASLRSKGSFDAMRPASSGRLVVLESLDNVPPIVLRWRRTGSNHGPPCALRNPSRRDRHGNRDLGPYSGSSPPSSWIVAPSPWRGRIAPSRWRGRTIVAVHDSKESGEKFRDTVLMPRMQQGMEGGFDAVGPRGKRAGKWARPSHWPSRPRNASELAARPGRRRAHPSPFPDRTVLGRPAGFRQWAPAPVSGPPSVGWGGGFRTDHQDGARRVAGHLGRDRADVQAREAAVAPGADHHQIGFPCGLKNGRGRRVVPDS